MIKLLLVDDEAIIREGILGMIDWKRLNIQVTGSCENGYAAIESMTDEMPDILMTDIKMPGMDGLELVERAMTLCPDLQCIILSGYDAFAFAQKAIHMGVRDYLLKPCDKETMEKALESLCGRLEKQRRQTREPHPYHQDFMTQGPGDLMSGAAVRRGFVEEMAAYIYQHYHQEDLSLQYLADHQIHMSADYIGKEFARDMGVKLSAFLPRVRMEQAKRLLKSAEDLRMYEIAQQIGLGHNPNYFSRLFCKYEGISPKEYRALWIQGKKTEG